MRYLSLSLLLCFLPILFFAPPGRACGDKLVPIGGGISFARITDEAPVGSIVIYVDAEQLYEHRQAIASVRKALERAGHRVLVTSDAGELWAAIQMNSPDMVLTSAPAVEAAPWSAVQPPLAPVVLRMSYDGSAPTDRVAPGNQGECTIEAGRRTSKGLARTVSEILRQRSEGVPMECAGAS